MSDPHVCVSNPSKHKSKWLFCRWFDNYIVVFLKGDKDKFKVRDQLTRTLWQLSMKTLFGSSGNLLVHSFTTSLQNAYDCLIATDDSNHFNSRIPKGYNCSTLETSPSDSVPDLAVPTKRIPDSPQLLKHAHFIRILVHAAEDIVPFLFRSACPPNFSVLIVLILVSIKELVIVKKPLD